MSQTDDSSRIPYPAPLPISERAAWKEKAEADNRLLRDSGWHSRKTDSRIVWVSPGGREMYRHQALGELRAERKVHARQGNVVFLGDRKEDR